MKDLKFRCWEPLNKKMHYLDFALYQFSNGFNSHKFVLPPERQSLQNPYTVMNLDAVKVMQFTGFENIYEGDILYGQETGEFGSILSSWHGLVYWDENKCGFYVKDDLEDIYRLDDFDYIDIVGNIHEHPNLINFK